jgi:hypothetical protein
VVLSDSETGLSPCPLTLRADAFPTEDCRHPAPGLRPEASRATSLPECLTRRRSCSSPGEARRVWTRGRLCAIMELVVAAKLDKVRPPTHRDPRGTDERYGEGSDSFARHGAKEAVLLGMSYPARGNCLFFLLQKGGEAQGTKRSVSVNVRSKPFVICSCR